MSYHFLSQSLWILTFTFVHSYVEGLAFLDEANSAITEVQEWDEKVRCIPLLFYNFLFCYSCILCIHYKLDMSMIIDHFFFPYYKLYRIISISRLSFFLDINCKQAYISSFCRV